MENTTRTRPIPDLEDRFLGCLLGLALGDALGARFEGYAASSIRARFDNPRQLAFADQDELWYTDDTQMAIGVAETLAERGQIDEPRLCQAFADNYVRSRGYGRGARVVIELMQAGGDYREAAQSYFPGGSYGNGAAMRVAPLGLLFRDDPALLWEQAQLSALPTHVHPLGIEGAQLLALAVGIASTMDGFSRDEFFTPLIAACRSEAFRERMQRAAEIEIPSDLDRLGNGIEALESVPTAIACFSVWPEDFLETACGAVFLGGDTDTIAAMAGAISGAYLGTAGIHPKLIARLESTPKGREYFPQLSERLHQRYQSRARGS